MPQQRRLGSGHRLPPPPSDPRPQPHPDPPLRPVQEHLPEGALRLSPASRGRLLSALRVLLPLGRGLCRLHQPRPCQPQGLQLDQRQPFRRLRPQSRPGHVRGGQAGPPPCVASAPVPPARRGRSPPAAKPCGRAAPAVLGRARVRGRSARRCTLESQAGPTRVRAGERAPSHLVVLGSARPSPRASLLPNDRPARGVEEHAAQHSGSAPRAHRGAHAQAEGGDLHPGRYGPQLRRTARQRRPRRPQREEELPSHAAGPHARDAGGQRGRRAASQA